MKKELFVMSYRELLSVAVTTNDPEAVCVIGECLIEGKFWIKDFRIAKTLLSRIFSDEDCPIDVRMRAFRGLVKTHDVQDGKIILASCDNC